MKVKELLMEKHEHSEYMRKAIERAKQTMELGHGGPFGAAIVKDGNLIAVSSNSVLKDCDPSAHAEVNAIRAAGKVLGTHDLSGCELYATGYPCPMCLSAIIWANISTVYYGCDPTDAEAIGFRDDFIYRYLENGRQEPSLITFKQLEQDCCKALFNAYQNRFAEL